MKVILFLTVFVLLNSFCTSKVTAPGDESEAFDEQASDANEASDFDSEIEDVSDIKEPLNTASNTDDALIEEEDGKDQEPLNGNLVEDSLAQEEDASENKDDVQAESSCVCAHRVQAALITALESCVKVLKAEESCSSRKKRASDTADIMSSCSCSQKVNAALISSLKSCTEALEDSAVCSAKYSSCAEIKQAHPSRKSGYYNLFINSKSVSVYCNMGTLCRAGGGWTRLGMLDMTNSSSRCPSVSGLTQYTANRVRMCGRSASGGGGCASIKIPSHNIKYTQVCGRVRGYQRYTTDGFHGENNINNPYVDGVSITHGSPRRHIWSLAIGYTENRQDGLACPCNTRSSNRVPSFVGRDYYCESGILSSQANRFFTSDPLWDGKLCRSHEAPCCPSGSLLPWFIKNIGTSTTDYIEVRVCTNESTGNENLGIDQYEFYVK